MERPWTGMDELVSLWPRPLVSADAAGAPDLTARLLAAAPLAFRVAYSVLRNRQDAEDVAQEALTTALGAVRRLRDQGRLEAWLVRITWRRAIDRRRAQVRRERREMALPRTTGPTVEDLALRRETEDRVWAEIERLPEKLRLPLVLSAIEGHDLSEVARRLDVPVGTVKSRLFQARRLLAERLRCSVHDTKTR
jgi:RNA polymerase sigma-70 factor, ECF subfamily